MAASARPQPEPRYRDVKEPFDFFSYQAGYLKGGLLPTLQQMAIHVPLCACHRLQDTSEFDLQQELTLPV
jgi:hypothetical protein